MEVQRISIFMSQCSTTW